MGNNLSKLSDIVDDIEKILWKSQNSYSFCHLLIELAV